MRKPKTYDDQNSSSTPQGEHYPMPMCWFPWSLAKDFLDLGASCNTTCSVQLRVTAERKKIFRRLPRRTSLRLGSPRSTNHRKGTKGNETRINAVGVTVTAREEEEKIELGNGAYSVASGHTRCKHVCCDGRHRPCRYVSTWMKRRLW